MSDYLQPQDLIDDKKHSTFFAEVITGKAGGVAGGANIDTATNAVTSQVQKTMPKIMVDAESAFDAQLSSQQSEFDAQLQAQGWNPVAGSFETGGTIVNRRDILWWEAAKSWYSWQGDLTISKVVLSGSTPASSGGVASDAWVDRTDGALREQLYEFNGVSLVGGAGRVIKTSKSGGISNALDDVIANGGIVDIDIDETISAPINKQLSGKDIKIISSGGYITISKAPLSYRVGITLTGTGTEDVFTSLRIKSDKTRGDGAVVVGLVCNNYSRHVDSSIASSMSAVINTVNVKTLIVTCHHYTNIWQQLSTDTLHPGVYGYGVVPIGADFVAVFAGVLGTYDAPIDRHSVYASSLDDGSAYCKSVHVFDNSIRQRVYDGSGEIPETGFEFMIKCVGAKNISIHDNDVDGGVGLSLTTFRSGQYTDRLSIHDNHGRTYSYAYLVSKQDESTLDGWFVARLFDSDNEIIVTSDNARAGVIENTYNWNVRSKYTSSAVSDGTWSNKAHAFEHKTSATASCEMQIDGATISGFKFIAKLSNVTRISGKLCYLGYYSGVAPITKVTAVSSVNIELASNSTYTAWKAYGASTNLNGISYFDSYFGQINCVDGSIPIWNTIDSIPVAGPLANRPWPVQQGQRYWETDQNRYVIWTGSKWVTSISTFPPISGSTATILSFGAATCDSGHVIYNTTTKKPCWFDAVSASWKYSDGTAVS